MNYYLEVEKKSRGGCGLFAGVVLALILAGKPLVFQEMDVLFYWVSRWFLTVTVAVLLAGTGSRT